MNEREIILEILMEILEKGEYSHLVLRGALDKYAYLDKQKRSFIKRCCEGTIEMVIRLDYCIDQFSKTKCKKMKPLIRTLLRMGAYQILFMDQIPDSAACNECVKLAKKRGFSQLSGFVNGVLRTLSREKQHISYPDEKANAASYMSVMYSMPEWIVLMWQNRYGNDQTKQMLQALLEVRPVTLRMRENLDAKKIEACISKMKEQHITVQANEKLAYAYEVEDYDQIKDIPGYEEGLFSVQDIGSMLVVEYANIKPGDTVIDVCAAPGGKSVHAADKLRGTGSVLARDVSLEKVSMLEENFARMQVENATAEVWDATVLDEDKIEKADVVIADLPCSGLGVIGRKGDIKYRVTRDDVIEVAKLQRKILDVVHQYVKPGGTLMFSTCTITQEENEDNRHYITSKLSFDLIEEKQLIPGVDGSDGFYMAKFKRKRA